MEENIKYLKDYFEPHFTIILEKLKEIKNDIDRLYDNHQNNNNRIIKIEERINTGNTSFNNIYAEIKELKEEIKDIKEIDNLSEEDRKRLNKIDGISIREKMLWSAVGLIVATIGIYILNKILGLI